jgi:predicted TPR repeat methyltransferase
MNTSFSTTESAPSDTGEGNPTTSTMTTPTISPLPKTSTPVQHIATQEAYDQWASVYDSDGNMLQSIDDDELSKLLPQYLNTVASTRASSTSPLAMIDLGCGTGRNTTKLVSHPWPNKGQDITIIGLDFSKGMLNVAEAKLAALKRADATSVQCELHQCDCFPTVQKKTISPMPNVPGLNAVDAVISTLVLEHIPLRDYFSTLASIIVKGGYALVTNMHSEMGKKSQAGFVNAQGVKVRGHSYAHTPRDAAEEARKAGFEVLRVTQRKVEESDVQGGIVGERGMKWIGVYVWYGLVLRKIV